MVRGIGRPLVVFFAIVLLLGAVVFLRSWRELPGPTAQGADFRFVPGHFGPRYPYHPPPPQEDRWWELHRLLPGGPEEIVICDDDDPLNLCPSTDVGMFWKK